MILKVGIGFGSVKDEDIDIGSAVHGHHTILGCFDHPHIHSETSQQCVSLSARGRDSRGVKTVRIEIVP